jgi:hypothetical protein
MINPLSSLRRSSRVVMALLAGFGLWAATVTASTAPASASTKHTPTKHMGNSAKSAKDEIIANWEAFFSGKTPAKRKIALVQDGGAFAKVIQGQSSDSLAKSSTAKVLSVKVTGVKAAVTYTVYLAGQAALKGQKGEAFLLGGTWKVGAQSFCGLLSMEGTKLPVCTGHAKSKK